MIVPAIELQSLEQGAMGLNEISCALQGFSSVHVQTL